MMLALRAKAERENAARLKQQALAGMLITSGFNFDGYKITKYSGYISGDDVVQIDRGSQGFFSSVTNVGEILDDFFVEYQAKSFNRVEGGRV